MLSSHDREVSSGSLKRERTEEDSAPSSTASSSWRPKKIAPSSFYVDASVHWKTKLNRLTKPLAPSEMKPDQSDESFPVFSKQEAAFKHADANPSAQLRIFSFEKPNFGAARQFVTADYEAFWERYSRLRPRERHFYEVIRENEPCHLYFDLEYQREFNQDVGCDEQLTHDFCSLLEKFICERVRVPLSRTNIVDLNSSTEKKYSRHLIVHLPGCMWRNNVECGKFVRAFIMFLLHERKESQEAARCFVNTDKDTKVFLADAAVYSRNRNFRLYKSSKVGKDAVLNPSESNQYRYGSERELFMASLICRPDDIAPVSRGVKDQDGAQNTKECAQLSGPSASSRLLTILDVDIADHEKQLPSTSPYAFLPRPPSAPPRNAISSDMSGPAGHSSPHPYLDAFVSTLINRGGHPGFIRSWLYYPEQRQLIYNVGGNRYCGNISRQHKSNHTMIIADLRKEVCYQKCHDPECKAIDYRSPDMPFPPEVRSEARQHLADEEIDRLFAGLDEEFLRKLESGDFSGHSNTQSSLSQSSVSSEPALAASSQSDTDIWAPFKDEEQALIEDMRLHPEKYP